MSKHIFTVEVECETEEDYLQAVTALGNIGDITDEDSDFKLE